jgi:DNA polymerase-3 subunit epsilon
MDITEALALVDASPDHRVLRRIVPPTDRIPDARLTGCRSALFVDCETTGLDHASAEIIEIAMVPFWFDDAGIAQVMDAFHAYNEPKTPITPEITKLTGITNEMVTGHRIDPGQMQGVVDEVARHCDLVIAHNAAFDRPFFEGLCPGFALRPWGCSMDQVPWDENGISGRRLEYIAASLGFFYDAHNAVTDCHAGIHVLGQTLPSGRSALAHLLDRALQDSRRVWAIDAPFDDTPKLKARGYRWNPGKDGRYKAWHKEVWPDDTGTEAKFLREEIYRGESRARSTAVTPPLTRFTVRG